MLTVLHGTLRLVADLVAPTRCAACDGEVKRGAAFCPSCVTTLERAANPDPSRIAAFTYGGAIAEALKRFKFDDRPDLAPALLAGLAPHVPQLRGADLVVPVPLHPSRLVERGYNQSALLARPLAALLGAPSAMRAVTRPRATARQTDLSREGRAKNMEGAFVAASRAQITGRQLLLVDDVETTGATLAACRSALLAGGARDVYTVVIARAAPAEGADEP